MLLSSYLLKVCSAEMFRRMLCLPSSEQPLSWLFTFSLDSTCVEGLNTGKEVLLCFFSGTFILRCHLTSRCLFYLFQEAQARGSGRVSGRRGQRSPEVTCCSHHRRARADALHHRLTPGRLVLAQSHTAGAVATLSKPFPGCWASF